MEPKVPKVKFPEMPKAPAAAPKMPEGAPNVAGAKMPEGLPKAPKVPKIKIGEMPAQGFKEKHAGLLNKAPMILMLLAAVGGGAYFLFFKKGKKKPAAAAGGPDGGVEGAAGGGGAGGGEKKVCKAPPANVPLEGTSADADSPEEKAKVDAQKLKACLRRPGVEEEIRLRVYPLDGEAGDTNNWVVKVIFGEDLDGDELELGPGLDISGVVVSEPNKKKEGQQDLVFQMKQVRSGGLEACMYRMTGRPSGASVELEKCEMLREGEEGTQPKEK